MEYWLIQFVFVFGNENPCLEGENLLLCVRSTTVFLF